MILRALRFTRPTNGPAVLAGYVLGSFTLAACNPAAAPAPAAPPAPLEAAPAPVATVIAPPTTPSQQHPMALLSSPTPVPLNIAPSEDQPCPPYHQAELVEPVRISPVNGVLQTELIVALRDRCVPVFNTTTNQWELKRLSLRTYGFPGDTTRTLSEQRIKADLDDPGIVWSAPGPTFVLTKATSPETNADGTNFRMTLYNAMPPQADPHACDPLHKVGDPTKPFTPEPPNCFHGDNSTNFHMHGSHVSPQPHQDYVGLELLPFGATPPEHATHTRGDLAIGSYQYNVDRIRYEQAEGTHWYHAHKHGSTALQVLNGLVGTFLIRGAFDTELERLFKSQGGLRDRLLVVQQLQEKQSGLGNDPPGPPDPLINGQANPILTMRPGEVQRWRFVGATMQDSARIDIGFPQKLANPPEVRQITMDGVQFAPENYQCQPILRGPDCLPGTADDSFKDLNNFTLAPGNRVDVLIKAPVKPGRYVMTFRVNAKLNKNDQKRLEARFAKEVAAAALTGTRPPLLTLVVAGDPASAELPSEADFPKLPAFLADISGPFKARSVAYQMKDQATLDKVQFSINNAPYDPSCVNETLTLDVPEQWTLSNDSGIAHPFHIHTNPFQMVSELLWVNGKKQVLAYKPPYVWRDTIPIPTASTSKPANLGQAVIRYVARDFTGEFVNHCHILGHEDRGMMHGVQATCKDGNWGKPKRGVENECTPDNEIPPAPQCE